MRLAAVLVTAAIAFGAGGGNAGTIARVAESRPSCLNHQWAGNTGVITVRTSPNRTIIWTVRDYTDNGGRWIAFVFVDGRMVDEKRQYDNPHGSVSPRDSHAGSVFSLDITHIDTAGKKSRNVPNGCVVP